MPGPSPSYLWSPTLNPLQLILTHDNSLSLWTPNFNNCHSYASCVKSCESLSVFYYLLYNFILICSTGLYCKMYGFYCTLLCSPFDLAYCPTLSSCSWNVDLLDFVGSLHPFHDHVFRAGSLREHLTGWHWHHPGCLPGWGVCHRGVSRWNTYVTGYIFPPVMNGTKMSLGEKRWCRRRLRGDGREDATLLDIGI